MPTIVWILLWVAAIAVVALLCLREVRSKRKGPGDFDRLRHSATADADLRSATQGPNGFFQGGMGG